MKARFSPKFYRKYKQADVRIQKSIDDRLRIFRKNPMDLELNNHLLREPYLGCRSIDITADWRAIYEEVQIDEEIEAYFLTLGTHNELFKNLDS